jgi:signal transduction histidine kinase
MGTWGAGGRLNIFDKSAGRFSRLVGNRDETEFKTGIDVRTICPGPDGNVWLGTWGNGLQKFDPRSGKFEYYYEHQGLANNFVKGMVFDESGNLWISTERGISQFQPADGRFRNFTIDDGLQGDLFLSGSAFRGRGGTLFFGGDRGLNFFHPDSIQDDLVPPPVVITGFRIFEKEQEPSFWRGTIAQLDHGQDFISFEFVGLDYTSPLRNRYSYMLEGFDRDWIEAGPRRYAAYTHLDGGDYTFRVRASNGDGTWNTEGASLQIRVKPPFWKAWWFTPAMVLTLLASAFIGFRLWFQHQLALERLRQRIASDLHDDVGTELSSIVLGSQYLAKTLPLGESDRSQIEKLGAAARNTHEMMRDIVWVLQSDNDTLEDLNLKMREVAARLLTGRSHKFHAPRPGRAIRFHPETKRNLFLFYKEALNNIIRHSSATSVEISILPLEDSVELVITDNGTGFDELRPGTGTGLRNLHARANAMKATVSIQSNPGGGTRIYLRTPPT